MALGPTRHPPGDTGDAASSTGAGRRTASPTGFREVVINWQQESHKANEPRHLRAAMGLRLRENAPKAAESPQECGVLNSDMGSSLRFYNASGRALMLRVLVVLAVLLAAWPVAAQEDEPALPSVIDIRVSTTPQRARLILDLSGTTEFAIASLTGPDRIAVDVRASALAVASPPPVAGSGIVAR